VGVLRVTPGFCPGWNGLVIDPQSPLWALSVKTNAPIGAMVPRGGLATGYLHIR
jgi:hypothetical protein